MIERSVSIIVFFSKKMNYISILFLFLNLNLFAQQEDIIYCPKIFAIGEASHGEQTIYEFRYHKLKSVINQGKNACILVEMPAEGGIGINNYLNEVIEKDSLLILLGYYGLKTDSFLSFIDSTKQYKDRIRYFGIDMQDHLRLFKLINNLYKTEHKSSILTNSIHVQFSQISNKDSLKMAIEKEFISFKNCLSDKIGSNTLLLNSELRLQLRQIEQSLEYSYLLAIEDNFNASLYRDSCMYANIKSVVEQSSNEEYILVFGANYHLSKMEKSCGWYLNKFFGKDYFVCGHQFLLGEVLSVDINARKRIIIKTKLPIFKKGFPYKLESLGVTGFINISNTDIYSKKLKKIISTYQYFLDFGGFLNPIVKRNFIWLIPSNSYDGIFYHRNAQSSNYLIQSQ